MAIPLTSDPSSTPPPEGRPAVQELAELLLLRRRPAIVAVVGVLLLGVLLAVLAPGLVPAGPLTGVVVGLLALVAAFAAMLAVDAADPIVRGPRHVRVTGRTVVGRVDASPTPTQVAPVVDGIVAALSATRRLRMTVVGVEQDTSDVARLVAEGVAAAGRTVLLVDLSTGSDAPGVTDVAAGTHRLGDVVRLEPGLQLAVTGAGTAPGVPAAAARLAATPPSDLDLLLTVLPRDERPGSGLLAGTDRVLALVPLGVLERDEVSRQLALLEQARSTRAAVVVVDPPRPEPPAPDPASDIQPFDDEPQDVVEDAPLFADDASDAPGDDTADDPTHDPSDAAGAPVDEPAEGIDDADAADDGATTPPAADAGTSSATSPSGSVRVVPAAPPGVPAAAAAAVVSEPAEDTDDVPVDELDEEPADEPDDPSPVEDDLEDVDDTTDLSDDTDRDAAAADAAPVASAEDPAVEEESEEEEPAEEPDPAADPPVDVTTEVPIVPAGGGPDLSVRDDDAHGGDDLMTTAALELLADERANGE